MRQLAILGSTGSIGVNTLNVVRAQPDRFVVRALAAGSNRERLTEQIREFRPECVAVKDAQTARAIERDCSCRVVHGPTGLLDVARHDGVDLVVSAIVGAVGMAPTLAAVEAGRDVALANKEALVVAGRHMTDAALASGCTILPIDSEHNALHQCLRGEKLDEVRRLWLTASGGPFRNHSIEQLAAVTREEALNHPTWKMGPKITIDSATLMNKGLEVIEARWLFGIDPDRIRVVVHPGSVVHSMVEFVDGSFKAQLGVTDMQHPIQYALSWPDRWSSSLPQFDPVAAGPLEFFEPDVERFPCLALAFRALESGGACPAVMNAANEVAVQAFLEGRIEFQQIPVVIAAAMDDHLEAPSATLEELLAADAKARASAEKMLAEGVRS